MAAEEKIRYRPLMATVSITVHVPPDVSDEEVLEKLKSINSSWTPATYTTGPDGDKKDDGGGIDIPV